MLRRRNLCTPSLCRSLQATVQLASSRDGAPQAFSGEFKALRDGADIVAIFDGACIRLELLSASLQLKCASLATCLCCVRGLAPALEALAAPAP